MRHVVRAHTSSSPSSSRSRPAPRTKPPPCSTGTDLAGCFRTDKDRAALVVRQAVQLDPKNPRVPRLLRPTENPDGLLVASLKDFQGTNLVTSQKFGDCTVRLEFLIPKDGNSGLFLMGLYELQLTDSLGIADAKMQEGDHGGIPFFKKPLANASLKPGEWQSCDVTFPPPASTPPAKRPPPPASSGHHQRQDRPGKPRPPRAHRRRPRHPESPTGPVMLQGNEGPVAFRHVTITPNNSRCESCSLPFPFFTRGPHNRYLP